MDRFFQTINPQSGVKKDCVMILRAVEMSRGKIFIVKNGKQNC